jgi:hypothetical protein
MLETDRLNVKDFSLDEYVLCRHQHKGRLDRGRVFS